MGRIRLKHKAPIHQCCPAPDNRGQSNRRKEAVTITPRADKVATAPFGGGRDDPSLMGWQSANKPFSARCVCWVWSELETSRSNRGWQPSFSLRWPRQMRGAKGRACRILLWLPTVLAAGGARHHDKRCSHRRSSSRPGGQRTRPQDRRRRKLIVYHLEGDHAVANREQRGNREKRKQKAEKPKPSAAQASPFSRTPPAGNPKGGPGKKGR